MEKMSLEVWVAQVAKLAAASTEHLMESMRLLEPMAEREASLLNQV